MRQLLSTLLILVAGALCVTVAIVSRGAPLRRVDWLLYLMGIAQSVAWLLK